MTKVITLLVSHLYWTMAATSYTSKRQRNKKHRQKNKFYHKKKQPLKSDYALKKSVMYRRTEGRNECEGGWVSRNTQTEPPPLKRPLVAVFFGHENQTLSPSTLSSGAHKWQFAGSAVPDWGWGGYGSHWNARWTARMETTRVWSESRLKQRGKKQLPVFIRGFFSISYIIWIISYHSFPPLWKQPRGYVCVRPRSVQLSCRPHTLTQRKTKDPFLVSPVTLPSPFSGQSLTTGADDPPSTPWPQALAEVRDVIKIFEVVLLLPRNGAALAGRRERGGLGGELRVEVADVFLPHNGRDEGRRDFPLEKRVPVHSLRELFLNRLVRRLSLCFSAERLVDSKQIYPKYSSLFKTVKGLKYFKIHPVLLLATFWIEKFYRCYSFMVVKVTAVPIQLF